MLSFSVRGGFRRSNAVFILLFNYLLNKADWIMAAPRRVIKLAFSREDVAQLTRLARSRTDPASRVERARMLLPYRETPSFYAVGRALGVTHQTVERCLRRTEKLGVMEALDDSLRPGRERAITEDARIFVVDLACRKPKDLGYAHELWTTRLLTRHIREHGPAAGQECLATLAQGTLCKILAAYEIKPHKVRYYLERRDPLFDEKMAEVLCVYREVELLKQSAAALAREIPAVAIISYDEKPGVQAIGTTAPDLPPEPLRHNRMARSRICSTRNAEPVSRHRSCDRRSPRQRGGKTSFARVRRLPAKARRRLSPASSPERRGAAPRTSSPSRQPANILHPALWPDAGEDAGRPRACEIRKNHATPALCAA
jgi:transposase